MLLQKQSMRTFILSMVFIATITMSAYANPQSVDIIAESAILIDAKSGEVLYKKNENRKMYPASITKLLTALIAMENQNPTDIITLSEKAVFSIERGSSHIGLDVGEEINLDQGLHALLLASANEVANGIAELCGGSISSFGMQMTDRAKELGATNTNFTNPHGLHDPNHYTTAYDMAIIASEVMKQPYFQEIMNDTTYQIPPTNKTDEIRYLSQHHRLMNEQRDSRMYRQEVIGGKTGFTSEAGNTLVTIAKKGDMELISVVLKSDSTHLYDDTNTILDYGFNSYKMICLQDCNSVLSKLPMYNIKSGKLIHVADCDITVDNDTKILVPSDLRERNISTDFSLPDKVNLSSEANEIIGSITYEYMGDNIGENKLVIKNINHIPSEKPAVYPPKPEYLSPKSSNSNYLIALVTTITIALLGLTILLVKYIKNIRSAKKRKESEIF